MTQHIEAAPLSRRPVDRGERIRQLVDMLGPFATVGIILLGWELLARQQIVTPFLLPAMTTVAARIGDDLISGRLPIDVALTLCRAFAGFAIAAVTGVALGLLIARFVAVRWFFDPIVSFGLPMPKIALMPIFMLWFGLFDISKILMVAFSVIFQIIISTWSATHSVEKELVWSARSLGASDRGIMWDVVLPAALPQILTGLQVALPIALIVALVTEMIMGGGGLGDTMLQSARYVDSPGVFAGIVEIGVVGYCCIGAMSLLRRRLLAWHQESSAGAAM
jgi:ABC-type nitrate/sulfonate/bicarbonate transport system permease component